MQSSLRFFIQGLTIVFITMYSQGAFAKNKKPDKKSPVEQDLISNKKFMLRVNPLGLIFSSINGGLDYAVTDKISLGLLSSYSNGSTGSTDLTAFGFGVRADFYLSGRVMQDSWYIAPEVEYVLVDLKNKGVSINGTDKTNTASSGEISGSLLIGYKWIWNNGFAISLGGGGKYLTLDLDNKEYAEGGFTLPIGFTGFFPAIELSLGFVF